MALTRSPDAPAGIPQSPTKIETGRLVLRTMEVADASTSYAGWMNDPEIVRYTESRFSSHSVADVREYISAVRGDPNSLLLAIETKPDSRHIGNIKIGPVDWRHRSGDIGLLIGEKDCWGQGFASEAIEALAGYARDTLRLERSPPGSMRRTKVVCGHSKKPDFSAKVFSAASTNSKKVGSMSYCWA